MFDFIRNGLDIDTTCWKDKITPAMCESVMKWLGGGKLLIREGWSITDVVEHWDTEDKKKC